MILLNWKANGSKALVEDFKSLNLNKNIVVLPPHHLLGENFASIHIGSQAVSEFDNGAYTGEITAQMLEDCGVKYCLVGHSERRKLKHENNENFEKQISNLIKRNIVPVLCVGENLEERQGGNYLDIIKNQLSVFKDNCIIAYEPIWSIGTGITPKKEEIIEIKDFIQDCCSGAKILYGGSVTSENIREILKTGVNGTLVGGASLKIEEVKKFNEIIK